MNAMKVSMIQVSGWNMSVGARELGLMGLACQGWENWTLEPSQIITPKPLKKRNLYNLKYLFNSRDIS